MVMNDSDEINVTKIFLSLQLSQPPTTEKLRTRATYSYSLSRSRPLTPSPPTSDPCTRHARTCPPSAPEYPWVSLRVPCAEHPKRRASVGPRCSRAHICLSRHGFVP